MSKPSAAQRLLRMSAVDLWKWVRQPRLEWAKVITPARIPAAEAAAVLFPEIGGDQIEAYRLEYLSSGDFFEEVSSRMLEKRKRRPRWIGWLEFFYIAVRVLRPQVICETGVFDGESSSTTLLALARNGEGTLVSVDLPAVQGIASSTDRMLEADLPRGCDPGWIIPEHLRGRWRLFLGDSKVMLPKIFEEYPQIDIFFHDSLHTFEHQYFEYSAAWPHLRQGGLLLSDDILWNHAFQKFCGEKHLTYVNLAERNHHYWTNFNEGFGAARK